MYMCIYIQGDNRRCSFQWYSSSREDPDIWQCGSLRAGPCTQVRPIECIYMYNVYRLDHTYIYGGVLVHAIVVYWLILKKRSVLSVCIYSRGSLIWTSLIRTRRLTEPALWGHTPFCWPHMAVFHASSLCKRLKEQCLDMNWRQILAWGK